MLPFRTLLPAMLPFRILLILISLGTATTFCLKLYYPSHHDDQQPLSFHDLSSSPSLKPPPPLTFRDLIINRECETNTGAAGKPWDHVYVINLKHREDRRQHMSRLAAALNISITFVEGVVSENPVVPWIMERLLDEQIAGESLEIHERFEMVQERKWGEKGGLTWRQNALRSLSPSSPSYALSVNPSNASLIYPPPHLSPETIHPEGQIACSLAHLKVFELAMKNEDQTFLVLEDDVDVEFALVDRWKEMKRGLEQRSEGWDMVYLGWIWSDEKSIKPLFHPHLRPSFLPAGLHAYSLSHKGVRKLYNRLLSSPSLFSRPLDHELPRQVIQPSNDRDDPDWRFDSWSVVPPLVLPGDGGLGTDIGPGGTEWGGILADSTWARIAAYDGHPRELRSDEEVKEMFAVSKGM